MIQFFSRMLKEIIFTFVTTHSRTGQIDFFIISSIVWLVVVFFAETLLNLLPLSHRWDTQALVHTSFLYWAHNFRGLAVSYAFHVSFEIRVELTQTFKNHTKGNADFLRHCCLTRLCQRTWKATCMVRTVGLLVRCGNHCLANQYSPPDTTGNNNNAYAML